MIDSKGSPALGTWWRCAEQLSSMFKNFLKKIYLSRHLPILYLVGNFWKKEIVTIDQQMETIDSGDHNLSHLPNPTTIRIRNSCLFVLRITVFLRHGQQDFYKASNSISDFLTLIFWDFYLIFWNVFRLSYIEINVHILSRNSANCPLSHKMSILFPSG